MSHKKRPEDKVKTVSVCFPPDIYKWLTEKAEDNKRSDLVVTIIKSHIARHEGR
jgi:hypothetical protein